MPVWQRSTEAKRQIDFAMKSVCVATGLRSGMGLGEVKFGMFGEIANRVALKKQKPARGGFFKDGARTKMPGAFLHRAASRDPEGCGE
ncbi:hypothetical protein [Pantoea agglomerans]|uniref:hypothetical protein n=1 Tax=Enterobacter agglomerans TaxID=549 RepID=UPI003C7A21F1